MAAALLVAFSSSALAQRKQDLSSYCEALRLFSSDQGDEAVARLSEWQPDALRRVAPQTGRCVGDATPALAVVALTSVAVASEDGPTERIASDLGIAESLLRNVTPQQLHGDEPAVAAFEENWFVVAGSLMLAWTNPPNAMRFITHGLSTFKNSVRLHTLSGAAIEMRAHLRDGNMHDPAVVAMMPRDPLRTLLFAAEGEYRRALTLDSAAIAARVRLGRVLYLRNEISEARQVLDVAIADRTAPAEWRYLAHLFAGAIAEYDHNLPRARTEYQAATMAMPDMQAGYIALSFIERNLGNEQRARELVAQLADMPAPDRIDPWSEYENGGFDMDALKALRAQLPR